MAATRTFSIIKPDATRRNLTGAVTKMLEEAGLRVVASKRIRMTRDQAEGFYAVHKERPFFNDLCTFMTSGPVVVQVLEGENAVQRNRDVMGATNPADAAGHDPQEPMPNRSRPIRSTARTATRMRRSRSPSSSSRRRNRRLRELAEDARVELVLGDQHALGQRFGVSPGRTATSTWPRMSPLSSSA
jgi:nucleoside-diphosphate kinase